MRRELKDWACLVPFTLATGYRNFPDEEGTESDDMVSAVAQREELQKFSR